MSVLGGTDEGVCCREMQMMARLGPARWQNRFLLERKYSQAASEETGGKLPTSRSLSPSNGDFVRHHEKQGMVSLAEQTWE